MAETIRGINVVIGAETTGLEKALGGVNKQSRDIQSELKEVEKLLKLDPSNTELLAQKQKLLGDAVGTTKDKLDKLKEAQSQVTAQFERGEISEAKYRAFQREVIRTEEELNRLEAVIRDTNNKWKEFGDNIGEFGDKSTALGQKLAPLSAGAGAVVAGLGALAVKAGQTADDINTLSKVTGVSVESLQKFKAAEEVIDVSTETMAKGLAKLTKSMAAAKDGSEKQKTAFAELGVAVVDSHGKLRDNEDVFNDTVEALSKITNETERDAAAFELFGKSAQDLNPLILGGADALKQIGDAASKAGLIMSQEALDNINVFNDELDTTKAVAAAAGLQLGATIGKELLPLLQEMAKGVQGVAIWLTELDPSVLKAVMAIGALIAIAAPLLMIIGQMSFGVQALVGMFGAGAAATGGLGAGFAALTGPIGLTVAAIAGIVIVLADLWKNNEEFRTNIITLWTELTKTVALLWNTFGDELTTVATALFEAVKLVVSTFVGVVTNVIKAFLLLIQGDWKGAWEAMQKALQIYSVGITGIIKNVALAVSTIFNTLVDSMFEVGKNIVMGIWNGIQNMAAWLYDQVKGFVDGIVNTVKGALDIHSPSRVFAGIGENIGLGLIEGIKGQKVAVEGMINGMVTPNLASGTTNYNSGGNTMIFNVSNGWDDIERELSRRGVRL